MAERQWSDLQSSAKAILSCNTLVGLPHCPTSRHMQSTNIHQRCRLSRRITFGKYGIGSLRMHVTTSYFAVNEFDFENLVGYIKNYVKIGRHSRSCENWTAEADVNTTAEFRFLCVHSVHSGTSVTQRVQMEDCLFDNDEYYPAPLFFNDEVHVLYVFVCLSVCLSVNKITQNACMNLDEILRIDTCRDTDKLVIFWAQSGS